jgi:hypothetical protein
MGKPVMMGEFSMCPEGNHNISQREWFKAFFEGCAESGIAGALYWILIPDPKRGYGVTYVTDRDEVVRQEILVGAQLMKAKSQEGVPAWLQDGKLHVIPLNLFGKEGKMTR